MDTRTTARVRWVEKLSQVIGAWFELLKSSSVNFFYLPSLVGHWPSKERPCHPALTSSLDPQDSHQTGPHVKNQPEPSNIKPALLTQSRHQNVVPTLNSMACCYILSQLTKWKTLSCCKHVVFNVAEMLSQRDVIITLVYSNGLHLYDAFLVCLTIKALLLYKSHFYMHSHWCINRRQLEVRGPAKGHFGMG